MNTTNEFTYQYDTQNRLTSGVSAGISMSEKTTYDVTGNIIKLTRDGNTNNYAYVGNKLSKVSGGITTQEYKYDGNGNAITEGRSGFTYTYNDLSLPIEIKQGAARRLINKYDANGNLLYRISNVNGIEERRDYLGAIEYKTIGSGSQVVDFIATEDGIAQNNNGSFTFQYFLRDHLGNVRTVIDKLGTNVRVLQRQDYYPYGKLSKSNLIAGSNEYLYNGKELLQGLSKDALNGLYDYGARFYDPELGRWNVNDPASEATRSISPYTYVNGNPIFYNDPSGMIANPFIQNILTGETKWIPDGQEIPLDWR